MRWTSSVFVAHADDHSTLDRKPIIHTNFLQSKIRISGIVDVLPRLTQINVTFKLNCCNELLSVSNLKRSLGCSVMLTSPCGLVYPSCDEYMGLMY